jgi:predicted Zn-dependent protease
MKREITRSMRYLRRPGQPRVYYLSYLFRNHRRETIWGRLGGVHEHVVQPSNSVYCDLRVGSYRYDNVTDGGKNDNSDKDESFEYVGMPSEILEAPFRYSLWRLTDAKYREAAEQFYEKRSKELHYVDPNRGLASKLRRSPVRDLRFSRWPDVDSDYFKRLVRRAGALVTGHTGIKTSWIEFTCQHRQSLFVDSEGSQLLQRQLVFELRAHLWLLTRRGKVVIQELNLVEGDAANLPSERDLLALVRARIARLLELEKAPHLNAYSGPVLLSPVPAGLFFHEVVGHRLEGTRLLSPEEGATFRDLQGKLVAPGFIDIVDDPTLERFGGRRMIGHFRFDDEGSVARRAVLVERGRLASFLTTSAPIPGQRALNGHARSAYHERPISRMGNLFVTSRNPVPAAEMRERFLEEIRRQKREFGIHVKETLGGETGTSAYDFQAFKGEIMHAVRVWRDGREEPVRGVDFVGTPLSALDSLVCLGDDLTLDNSYCTAESGTVPVSTVSPSALMRNLELQSKHRERLTQYAVPLPYDRGRPPAGRCPGDGGFPNRPPARYPRGGA